MNYFMCGTPKESCCGGLLKVNFAPTIKAHSSSKEAFNCKRNHLISLGYSQIGTREFLKEGEPVLFLTKKSRFGGKLRKGKEAKESRRAIPNGRVGGTIF